MNDLNADYGNTTNSVKEDVKRKQAMNGAGGTQRLAYTK